MTSDLRTANSLSVPISARRAAWLIISLRARRAINRARDVIVPRPIQSRRGVTVRGAWASALPLTLGALFVWFNINQARHTVRSIVERVGEAGLPSAASSSLLALVVSLGFVAQSPAQKDISRLGKDLEWLLTLPASLPTLRAAKIAHNALLNWLGWAYLFPFLIGLGMHGGHQIGAFLPAFLLCLPIFFAISVWQVAAEASARLWLPPLAIRIIPLLCTVLGVAALVLASLPGFATHLAPEFVDRWLRWAPYSNLLPFTEPARLMLGRPFAMGWLVVRYLTECASATALGLLALNRVYASGAGAEDGRSRAHWGSAQGKARTHNFRFADLWPIGVFGKDLRWALRSAVFLQELWPAGLLVVGLILTDELFLPGFLETWHAQPAASFGCGLLFFSFATGTLLRSEEHGGWLLFTAPISPTRILRQKLGLWWVGGACCALPIVCYGAFRQPLTTELLAWDTYALFGLILYGVIGCCMTLQDFNSERDSLLGRVARAYLLLIFAGPYLSAFFVTSLWALLPVLIIATALALAYVQNALRAIPYLFDESARPPPTLLLTDGLLAAFFFVFMQGVLSGVSRLTPGVASFAMLLSAFSGAGAFLLALVVFILRQRGVIRPLKTLALSLGQARPALFWSVLGSALAVAIAFAAEALAAHWAPLRHALESQGLHIPRVVTASDRIACILLFVCAAPLVEEVIFRGMIYQSMRGSLGAVAALFSSAALFAAFHPLPSFVPVFVVGALAALALEKSRSLVPAMLIHAAYNAALIWPLICGTF